jgi:hypothetical protein
MKISLLLPTRCQPKWIIDCVASYYDTASGRHEIETLLAFDNDDPSRFEVQETLKSNPQVVFFERPPVGFFQLHQYTNFLAAHSTGKFLCITSDKAISLTPHWDRYLEPFENRFFVSSPVVEYITEDGVSLFRPELLFPIVSRLWYDVLGHVSTQPHLDSYIGYTMAELTSLGPEGNEIFSKTRKLLSQVRVQYDRRKERTRAHKKGSFDFFSLSAHEERRKAAEKILVYLNANPHRLPEICPTQKYLYC